MMISFQFPRQCKSTQAGPLLTCLLINPATRHRAGTYSGKRHLYRAVCRREGPVCPSRRGVQRTRDRRVMLVSVRRQRHLSGDRRQRPSYRWRYRHIAQLAECFLSQWLSVCCSGIHHFFPIISGQNAVRQRRCLPVT